MALGTPSVGGIAYSAQNGTSVSPAYPATINAGDGLLLVVGQKPSTANSGSVTTPSGWTMLSDNLAQGGYGTTIGADTGNTNLRVYSKDTVNGTETGNLSVTLGTNNVSWAVIVRIPASGGAIEYSHSEGADTTGNASLSVTGATSLEVTANDVYIASFCMPTDAVTGWSAFAIAQSGITMGTEAQLAFPDSAVGNDIGGLIFYGPVTSGSSTAAPTMSATAAGTVTNVRGPGTIIRVREGALPTITGSLSATEGATDDFTATGNVLVEGALSVSEVGNDTFSATGTVMEMTASGSLVATETGNDTFSASGKVIVEGSLVATEVGTDSFTASGKVIVEGSFAATETGNDTFSASGEVADIISAGDFAATETGSDIFAGLAKLIVTGTLSSTELSDSFASTGAVRISGVSALVETVNDTFAGLGVTTEIRSGSMAATEAADTLGSYATDGYVTDGYTINGWQGYVYYEIPLPSTVLAGVRYGANGQYVGTLTGGGTGTRIEINTGKIVKLVGDTGALLLN